MVGIYRITNLVNGKTYIGQSIDIKRRFYEHRCISHESNIHLRRALEKYGKDNFKYEVLEKCDVSELDEKEIYYISTLKPEYNVSNGGQSSLKTYPEEVKKVISQKAKAQWERMTDEEKIVCVETREIFDSVKEAGERLNVNPSNISNVLKGRQKSVKGHRFEYLEV